MITKHYLQVELGTTPEERLTQLQTIKDAMVQAMLMKIDTTGITDAQDPHYEVWQAIYLQSDNQAQQPAQV